MWKVVLYLSPTTAALFVAAIVGLAALGAWWYGREDGGRAVLTARVLLAAWAVLVLMATITPTQPLGTGGYDISWVPGGGLWESGGNGYGLFPEERDMLLRQQAANAAMFVSLAALLAFSAPRWPPLALIGSCLVFSVVIEAVQFVMAAGRTVDVDDVLFNTLGGALGVFAVRLAVYAVGRLIPSGGRRRKPRLDHC
ncbi:VanZ family protein [Streptomyces gobiensis]|uniref:VanZ family protein n=1 Tax=Streptomyces gobiensis TaxID=2875706 RepID=UPI001E527910|nr:VanZ family protein [Streptomyces gobiensis]UGY92833.1 VanZ family protein [Streptomyces gobiensis]